MRKTNALIISGTGKGKSFQYIKPHILQGSCSVVVTDPDRKTYARLTGQPYDEPKMSPEEEAAIHAKWNVIYSDVAEILREINPNLSESDSLELAKEFFSEAYPYDYLYHRKAPNGQNCIEAFDFRESYGAEPFFFTEDNRVQAVNKPVFKEWVEDLIKIKVYCPAIRE